MQSVPEDNAVLDGIRTVASLLGQSKLYIYSFQGLIGEMPCFLRDDKKRMPGEDAER